MILLASRPRFFSFVSKQISWVCSHFINPSHAKGNLGKSLLSNSHYYHHLNPVRGHPLREAPGGELVQQSMYPLPGASDGLLNAPPSHRISQGSLFERSRRVKVEGSQFNSSQGHHANFTFNFNRMFIPFNPLPICNHTQTDAVFYYTRKWERK
jgi:hypothetical protein